MVLIESTFGIAILCCIETYCETELMETVFVSVVKIRRSRISSMTKMWYYDYCIDYRVEMITFAASSCNKKDRHDDPGLNK